MRRAFLLAPVLAVLAPCWAAADKVTFELTVAAGKHDRKDEPVCVPLSLPKGFDELVDVEIQDGKGKRLTAGQLTPPSLLTEGVKAPAGKKRYDLHFTLPSLKAGAELTVTASISDAPAKSGFSWVAPKAEEGVEGGPVLRFNGRPVLRYVRPELDDSTKAKREQTYKVFHHAYAPDGKRLVTKGPGGKFTHHRGLFYGFNKTTYDGTPVDIWHCTGDTHQAHDKVLVEAAGPVLGRHRVAVLWNGKGKKTFAREERELTAYHVPGGNLLEFTSRLTPTAGRIKLDGDPQHAGFHFRADDEVASKTTKETVFIRPDGVGKPGTERNWTPKDTKHVNLPWLAMSFVLGKQRYTAAYLDRPTNPKEARFSERTYGRFGSYFATEVTKDKPLLVRYRVWLQEGTMKPEEVAAKSTAFTQPVEVKVKEVKGK